ncbi:transposon Tf2-6 polyprotein [Trichonephila clavipes]|nr:transposon Tf2-6 polyprotein [Trichonephila clavipes]
MSEGPILHLYKYGRKTELHTDAYKQGYGAILLQEAEDGKLHPVCYMSKKTNTAEENISEDNAKKELITRIARWALQLEEFDYEIEHRAGSHMKHVDALSRYPVMMDYLKQMAPPSFEKRIYSWLRILIFGDIFLKYSRQLKLWKKSTPCSKLVMRIVYGRDLCNAAMKYGLANEEIARKQYEREYSTEVKICGLFVDKDKLFLCASPDGLRQTKSFERNYSKTIEKFYFKCVLPEILDGRAPRNMPLREPLYVEESSRSKKQKMIDIANKKTGKKEGFLNPISKESIPLSTYHVDFIGPLPSKNKNYQHIFTVVDAFTKYTWLYPVKTVSAESALEKLKQQQKTFGNPIRIISDRGSAFTSKLFNDYCDEENIQHLQIATGVPRGNGQVERIHRTLIPVLTKLSLDDSTKWYKYVDRLQRILNSTISRSTKWTPFELLVGIKMRNKEDILIKDLLLEEMAKELLEQREFLRNDAKKIIETLQSENRKTYNRRRKKASLYKEGDLVAIQRTQFGAGLKLRPKFLGPYKVTKVNSKDRYEVEKVGQHEGLNSTTTSADLMKHFYA